MKKLFLFTIATMFAIGASAQFYGGLGVGYGFGAGKMKLGVTEVTSGTPSVKTSTNIYGSLGQGIKPVLKFGYMFNESMGFELGFNYLMGSIVTVGEYNNPSSAVGKVTAQAKILALSPSFVFQSSCGGYTRMGLYMPISGATTQSEDLLMGASSTQSIKTTEFKGRFSVGFTGAVGYLYSINDKMGIYGELEYVGLTIKRNTSEITEWMVAGVDQIPLKKTYDLQTEYVDELTNAAQTNKEIPKQDLSSVSQYSSFGFNIGFMYKF